MALTFSGGAKIIYKPRGLRMDVAWQDLVAWLRERDPTSRLRAPVALDSGDYGWVEYIEPGRPSDPAAYYRSAGELVALAWICGGSDFHEENVIATEYGPVLIDLETLFTPTPRPFGATEPGKPVTGLHQLSPNRLTQAVLEARRPHALSMVLVVTLADQTQHRIYGD